MEPRIKQVDEDPIRHVEERNTVHDGKGMIVAISCDICARLYTETQDENRRRLNAA